MKNCAISFVSCLELLPCVLPNNLNFSFLDQILLFYSDKNDRVCFNNFLFVNQNSDILDVLPVFFFLNVFCNIKKFEKHCAKNISKIRLKYNKPYGIVIVWKYGYRKQVN